MTSVAQSVHARSGLAATFELYADGHSRYGLAAAVRTGAVVRVRQGWFAGRDIHPTLRQAARVGGRLTCLSALDLQGAWSYPTDLLHVAVPSNSCRLRTPNDMRKRLPDTSQLGVRVHWRDDGEGSRLMLSPLSCLADLIECQPPDVATATAGSVLRTFPGLWPAWRELLSRMPIVRLGWLADVDGVCESGTESLVWFRMRPFRLPIRRQVHIPGVGRVDFRMGERLIIEVDGAAYHTDPERFEADRHRDAVLSRLGYRVLRFSYRQVLFAWPEVEAAILAAVIRGDHHRA